MGVSQLQNFAARLILFVSEKNFSSERVVSWMYYEKQ